MRIYHLSATAVGLGLSPIQVIKNGRVKQIQISIAGVGTDGQGLFYEVGAAAVSDAGNTLSNPSNFLFVQGEARTGALRYLINESFPCDFPVVAGQNLVLNIQGNGVGDATNTLCEFLVFVQD